MQLTVSLSLAPNVLCCALLVACQGKQPCISDNRGWLRIPEARVAQIADILRPRRVHGLEHRNAV